MRMRDFKLYLKENEELISEISYILPDDSETKSKGIRIPEMVENQPYFSASVLLNQGTDDEGESLILVQNPRVLNSIEPLDGNQSTPKQIQKPVSESLEVSQSRQFYESMMQMNQMSYERIFDTIANSQKYVMDTIRENEKVLDRRLRAFLKDAKTEFEDLEPDSSKDSSETGGDSLKLITDAVVGVFKRINKEEKSDE